jgi:hypothetical protein
MGVIVFFLFIFWCPWINMGNIQIQRYDIVFFMQIPPPTRTLASHPHPAKPRETVRRLEKLLPPPCRTRQKVIKLKKWHILPPIMRNQGEGYKTRKMARPTPVL